MAKLAISNEKASAHGVNLSHLPLKEYVDSIADKVERYKVKEVLKCACRITSDTQLWRILTGRTSPNQFQREAIAEVMRHYMQNAAITGEDLFPEHLYPII